ncbi:MAG: hypothetical protein V1833_05410 [Elusimicrobiota bacterium]
MSEFEKWLTICASVITIIGSLLGFFFGKRKGVKMMQEQKQVSDDKKQYQKQMFEN